MRVCFLLFSALFFAPVFLSAQEKRAISENLKEGVFYYAPKNTQSQILIRRANGKQVFTDIINGDTSAWKIEWLNDSIYTLKFISCSCPAPNNNVKLNEHIVVHQIIQITEDYYLYKETVDNAANKKYTIDTVWRKENKSFSNILKLIQPVNIHESLKKKSITDTSSFALLFFYRKSKLVLSLLEFNLYLNDILLTKAGNHATFVLKLFKEGTYELKATAQNTERKQNIDVKFGKRYFVRGNAIWSIHSLKRNHSLELVLVDEKTGVEEFQQSQ